MVCNTVPGDAGPDIADKNLHDIHSGVQDHDDLEVANYVCHPDHLDVDYDLAHYAHHYFDGRSYGHAVYEIDLGFFTSVLFRRVLSHFG